MNESKAMKILKIKNGNGFYLIPGKDDWLPIDTIDKDGLMSLLNSFLEQDVEMDSVTEDNLSNQAHLIIYKSVYEKLSTLSENKSKFKDESERMYLDEIRKYSKS